MTARSALKDVIEGRKRRFDDIELSGRLIERQSARTAGRTVETRIGRGADQGCGVARLRMRRGVVLRRTKNSGLRIVGDRIDLVGWPVIRVERTSENADIDEMVGGIDGQGRERIRIARVGNFLRRKFGARADIVRNQISSGVDEEKETIDCIDAGRPRERGSAPLKPSEGGWCPQCVIAV